MAMATDSDPGTKPDDKGGGIQKRPAEDSDEDLCDVAFPVIDGSASDSSAGDADADRTSAAGGGGGGGSASAHREVRADEDAVARCFDASVRAHVEGGEVHTFEPVPAKNGKEGPTDAEDGKRGGSSASNATGGEWRPAPLPMPSWAKDFP